MSAFSSKLIARIVVCYVLFILYGIERASCSTTVYLNLVRPVSAGVDGDIHHLNIREIQAYGTSRDLLTLIVDSFESQMASNPVNYSIDGNTSTVAKSFDPPDVSRDHFFKYEVLDISDICEIREVNIYNEIGSARARLVGSYLEIIENSTTLMRFNLSETALRYREFLNNHTHYSEYCSLSYVNHN